MNNKVKSLIRQIEDSPIISFDGHDVKANATGDTGANEVALNLTWGDADEGYEYEAVFTNQALSDAFVIGGTIDLVDAQGEACKINLFNLVENPIVKTWECLIN